MSVDENKPQYTTINKQSSLIDDQVDLENDSDDAKNYDQNDGDFDDLQDDGSEDNSDPEIIENSNLIDEHDNNNVDAKAENTNDSQVNYLRFKSQFRLKSEWERICEKYSKDFGDVADEIDLVKEEVIVDRGCLKKLRVTGIGSMVNEVDLKGVDEAWALPEVQQKFMESQSQVKPVLSLSLELSNQVQKDDLISYDCSKTVHKDPFESDEDDRAVMSSPGVYGNEHCSRLDRHDYQLLSEPIYQNEYEILEDDYYLEEYFEKVVYEPLFVQPVPVYYEEYEEYPPDLEFDRYSMELHGYRTSSIDSASHFKTCDHKDIQYMKSHRQQEQVFKENGSKKFQIQQNVKEAKGLKQLDCSSEDDLLI